MSQDEKRRIITRFVIGMAIWMAILLIITFSQGTFSRGLFFLAAIGVSLVYFGIAYLIFSESSKARKSMYGGDAHDAYTYQQGVTKNYSYFAVAEILFIPGRILGSWISGIFKLRKLKD